MRGGELIKVGILGGSGYGGSELLRILLFHSEVDVKLVTANEHAGKRVDAVHPNLAKLTGLKFEAMTRPDQLDGLDCVFLALPHGQAMELAPSLPRSVKAIDLSGDFRLNDADEFRLFYGREHTAMQTQREFVYGLTEVNRSHIAEASRIANPGCFATALELGLYPLVASGLVKGKVIADLKTGSSGSGAKAAANTHHPKRTNSFYAYKTFEHQHQPEVEQLLKAVSPQWASDCSLVFQTHSIPAVRGIFASIYVTPSEQMSCEGVGNLFREFYGNEFFIRLVDGSPDINWVKNTNFVDIGWAARGDTVIVFVALDNLV
jgi:N-acetyl-gamma-glutamyl-phosphate reductase